MRRAGGDQVIPRPAVWHLGGPPPWAALTPPEVLPVDDVVRALRARGPGRSADLELDGARSSAVLIVLYDGGRGAEVVLTRRTQHVSTHKGEVSFPGGRMDPGETPVQTALREAHEEVGLDPAVPEVVGELDHLATVASRSHIVPVVARLPGRPTLVPARAEVARVLHVPLVELLEPGTYREERWGAPPLDRSVYFFDLDDETVWGATARMLAQLLGVTLGGGGVIEAGAFTLRPWNGDDTAFVFEACQDQDIARWTRVPKPYRPGDAAAFVQAHARPQPEPAGAWFAITRTETGELLGSISLHDLDRAASRGELGYWLAADARGEGAAAASLDALARWCLEHLALVEVEVRVAPGNLASQRVADRAGFVPRGVVPGGCNDGDTAVDALVFVRGR